MNRYSDSGVNIGLASKLVEAIKPLASSTANHGVISGIGGFGALYDPFSGNRKYGSPVLVSSTDGVGTKLLVAQETKNHRSVGIDLVAMCVNDVLVQGAKPMFFLDYFATGSLDHDTALEIVSGITEGCVRADTALVGGETAEMPGMYPAGSYDLAGFSVGIVERSEILPRIDQVCAGDIIVGLASSGPHSNGFSLIRKVLKDRDISYGSPCPFADGATWADVLLEPTRIYVGSVLPVLHMTKAAAHITGGGLIHNIPRVLPKHLAADIRLGTWKQHRIFTWLEQEAKIPKTEMFATFNCGLGMILITSEDKSVEVQRALKKNGEDARIIGSIVPRESHSVVLN
ncbi:phosphoribosylformylglycinamidine cyclo-ligase [Anaplasma capra]|uniref:phosphoribosylformylglycinamidine cyclo-ligase n=1 Tax=Anaplasma capra TaxID=1562740 RepID=UPI0021D58C1F|nr:phosphoribosylformylglycinamidine cyclo-ligase [Anaplasma capra]MCU7611814.1 phosphoribosylformylglycinamidine cyclo-ligase [Anaplasma capra]MCU7612592.1 phosphoribosylformylglycinamidine cyclo-ligase [Anaplasma capra]